jgi:hypothetical protein
MLNVLNNELKEENKLCKSQLASSEEYNDTLKLLKAKANRSSSLEQENEVLLEQLNSSNQ